MAIESVKDRIDFRLFGKILYKRRWTIAAFFIIVVTLVTISTMVQTPIYRADATIQIEPAPPEVVSFKDVVTLGSQSFWANKEYFQTQFWIIKSDSLAKEVVDELDLTVTDPVFAGNPKAARQLSKMVSVQPLKNSQLVKVSVSHPNAEMSAKICNVLALKYQEQNVDFKLKDEIRSKILDSLSQKSLDKESTLEQSETELLDFMKKHNIVSFEGRQNIVLSRLTSLSEALTDANRKRIETQASYQQAKSLKASGSAGQLPEVTDNMLIQELKEERILLQKKYSELTQQYQSEHPTMQKLTNQIELLESKITEEIYNIIGSYKVRYLMELGREKELEKAVQAAKTDAQSLNEKAIEYGILRRKVDSEKEIFDELVRRTKETQVMQKLNSSNISIRAFAEVPQGHISPKRKTNILFACVLGLFGGIALAFLLEYMDTRIKSQEDLERATGLPFLGVIPSYQSESGHEEQLDELFTHNFPKSSITESIRAIRTNLMFSMKNGANNNLLVTSAGPQEGKSSTVINLGIIFAQGGKRVLIVDSDLRRPRLHKAFGVSRNEGLTNLMMGEATVEESVQSTKVDNLWILPCGPIPPNPSELLGSERMDQVITMLQKKFDMVLYDSPPIVAVTDAVVLSKKIDGVVMIVKSGKTTSDMIIKAKRRLEDVKAPMLGTVLNDFNIRGEGYRYYYYYRYYRKDDGEQSKRRVKKMRDVTNLKNSDKKPGSKSDV